MKNVATYRAVHEVFAFSRIVVCQWYHYSASTESIFQFLEVLCVAESTLEVFVIYVQMRFRVVQSQFMNRPTDLNSF